MAALSRQTTPRSNPSPRPQSLSPPNEEVRHNHPFPSTVLPSPHPETLSLTSPLPLALLPATQLERLRTDAAIQREHNKQLSRRLREEAAARREDAAAREREEEELREEHEKRLEAMQREKSALLLRIQARALGWGLRESDGVSLCSAVLSHPCVFPLRVGFIRCAAANGHAQSHAVVAVFDRDSTHRHRQELEQRSMRAKVASAEPAVALTPEERAQLKQEVEEQERFLRAFQAENEAAGGAMRRAQAQWRERERVLSSENRRLASEVSALQAAGTASKVTDAQRLRRMLNAEAALIAAREQLAEREALLKADSDRARARARELERQVAALSAVAGAAAAGPAGDAGEPGRLRGELERERRRAAEEKAALEAQAQALRAQLAEAAAAAEAVERAGAESEARAAAQSAAEAAEREASPSRPATAPARVSREEAAARARVRAGRPHHPPPTPPRCSSPPETVTFSLRLARMIR